MKIILVLVVFFVNSIFADVKVEWGEGQLKLIDTTKDVELQGQLKILQTQLLIDNEVSNILLTKQSKTLIVPFTLEQKKDLTTFKSTLKKAILKSAKAQGVSRPKSNKMTATNDDTANKEDDSEDDDEPANYEIENNKSLVVVGKNDEYFVEEGDVIQQLIVLGGKVKIEGQVNRLVLMSGQVDVLVNGKINEKVTQLAGDIKVDQGGFVTKDKTGFFDQFNISSFMIDQFTDLSNISSKLVLALVRFIQVIFLLWLSLRLIPYFKKELLVRKYSWLKEGFTGLLHICVIPFVTFIFSITIVGISLIPIYATLLYLLGLLGYGLLSSILGCKILSKRDTTNEPQFMMSFIVGFIVFEALMLLPVFGYMILSVLLIVSVGLMTNVFWKYRKEV